MTIGNNTPCSSVLAIPVGYDIFALPIKLISRAMPQLRREAIIAVPEVEGIGTKASLHAAPHCKSD
jgi:hypothetical protein